jgi:hypothetical protein
MTNMEEETDIPELVVDIKPTYEQRLEAIAEMPVLNAEYVGRAAAEVNAELEKKKIEMAPWVASRARALAADDAEIVKVDGFLHKDDNRRYDTDLVFICPEGLVPGKTYRFQV